MRDTAPGLDAGLAGGRKGGSAAGTAGSDQSEADDALLARVRAAYESSTTWLDSGWRRQVEDAMRLFQSRHPAGSVYHSDDYRDRSKLFVPKTRSAQRQAEAQVAAALFQTGDQVSFSPANEETRWGRASAELYTALINYRLEATIPWFQIAVGAFQDAKVQGACVAKVWWEYREVVDGTEPVIETDPETGAEYEVLEVGEDGSMVPATQDIVRIACDRPRVDLIPLENVRFDPAAQWTDPIQASDYLMVLHPMSVAQIRARMESADPKTGQPAWRKYDDAVILSARDAFPASDNEGTRQVRENPRDDPQQRPRQLSEHDIVQVCECFFRDGDTDMVFWTLATSHVLTDPIRRDDAYLHSLDRRPYEMGVALIEAHRAIPTPPLLLTAPLQYEANHNTNLRIDGINLALSPRQKVRAGAVQNLETLRRFAPGKPVIVGKMDDIEWERAPDVSAATFAQEDRLNAAFDELAGNFSQSSVMVNRRMNETVGGMGMLRSAAGAVGDLDLRTWVETFVLRVMRQLLALEQCYETDEVVLALAGQRARLGVRYGMSEITDDLLRQQLIVRVNAAIGQTDPMQKMQRFAGAFRVVGSIIEPLAKLFGPAVLQSPGFREIAGEVFGFIGYRDEERFLDFGPPPEPQQDGADAAATAMQADMKARDIEERARNNQERLKLDRELGFARLLSDRDLKLRDQGIKDDGQRKQFALDFVETIKAALHDDAAAALPGAGAPGGRTGMVMPGHGAMPGRQGPD